VPKPELPHLQRMQQLAKRMMLQRVKPPALRDTLLQLRMLPHMPSMLRRML